MCSLPANRSVFTEERDKGEGCLFSAPLDVDPFPPDKNVACGYPGVEGVPKLGEALHNTPFPITEELHRIF